MINNIITGNTYALSITLSSKQDVEKVRVTLSNSLGLSINKEFEGNEEKIFYVNYLQEETRKITTNKVTLTVKVMFNGENDFKPVTSTDETPVYITVVQGRSKEPFKYE